MTHACPGLRLAHARRFLERSDKAISEICYEVGFWNLSNFNSHFLHDTGETPRHYHQRHRADAR
jgi:AraC-like DNA-binding protein